MGVPKEWWEVSEPTWAEFGGWWWHLARGTIYALHKAAREPNCCLLVLGGGRLLLLQRLRRLWEVKWETAVAAALFSAPLSPHITEISPQTFPSPALLPLHITSADPLSLDPSASAPLHLQGRDERRGAHGVQVQTQHKNAFFSTSPPRCILLFASYKQVNHWPWAVNESLPDLTSHTGCKGCVLCAQLWASLLLLLVRMLVGRKLVHRVRMIFFFF